jgi:lysozyme family protein
MAVFEKAFAKTVAAEGGYVNNPNDRGGETYMGITRKNYPKLKMWATIDKLKNVLSKRDLNSKLSKDEDIQKEVKEVYKKNYWTPLKLDLINSQRVANEFFDISVNCGTKAAIKSMQRTAGLVETGRMNTQTIEYYVKRYKGKS